MHQETRRVDVEWRAGCRDRRHHADLVLAVAAVSEVKPLQAVPPPCAREHACRCAHACTHLGGSTCARHPPWRSDGPRSTLAHIHPSIQVGTNV
eukprot:364269-Chlamydomonas_euryale.AAC.7